VRRRAGFTIVEIIVVLLLMSILAATVLGRSVTTTDLDLNSATDKLRNQLRYAQAEAMKLAYKDYPVWGINFISGGYWLFRGTTITTKVQLPGVNSDDVNLATSGISVSTTLPTVFFDRIGKPYSAYTTETNNIPLSSLMKITMTAGGQTREITITPETGLIR
jgi:prepilin-type N-terminal cleavage/methylation domain-containing protein